MADELVVVRRVVAVSSFCGVGFVNCMEGMAHAICGACASRGNIESFLKSVSTVVGGPGCSKCFGLIGGMSFMRQFMKNRAYENVSLVSVSVALPTFLRAVDGDDEPATDGRAVGTFRGRDLTSSGGLSVRGACLSVCLDACRHAFPQAEVTIDRGAPGFASAGHVKVDVAVQLGVMEAGRARRARRKGKGAVVDAFKKQIEQEGYQPLFGGIRVLEKLQDVTTFIPWDHDAEKAEHGPSVLQWEFEVRRERAPAVLLGKYCKWDRCVSQSPWLNGEGDVVGSVTEYCCAPLEERCAPVKTKFHASGREDVNVRMLGGGRPFLVQAIDPLRPIDADVWKEDGNVKVAADVDESIAELEKAIAHVSGGLVTAHGMKLFHAAHADDAMKIIVDGERNKQKTYRAVHNDRHTAAEH